MKLFCVFCLIHVTLQLKCDKTHVTVPVGGELFLLCSFNFNRFLFSKKYWCKGSSPFSCEILAHSETSRRSNQKWTVLDAGAQGLFVMTPRLTLEDTGTYWLGIDKIYADIMTSVEVIVTEVRHKHDTGTKPSTTTAPTALPSSTSEPNTTEEKRTAENDLTTASSSSPPSFSSDQNQQNESALTPTWFLAWYRFLRCGFLLSLLTFLLLVVRCTGTRRGGRRIWTQRKN